MQSRDDRKNNNRQFQEASSLRKASNDTQFFWDMVNRNRGPYGAAGARRPVNKAQEEKVLFGKANAETVEHGFIDDNIPVERSGPRADEIPVLATFAELEGQIPSYVTQNIKLMKYVHPTPIQKHAVPLGLAGVDLMCCAQTVRNRSSKPSVLSVNTCYFMFFSSIFFLKNRDRARHSLSCCPW